MTRTPEIHLTGEALDLTALLIGADAHSGASAHFIGRVRGGDGLTGLELLHHPVLTLQAMSRLANDAMSRFSLESLTVAHRYGRMAPGDPIVFIAAGAPHRRAAIDAMTLTIDLLKTAAPFWKREWRGENAVWIEPVEADHDAAARWLEETR